MLSPAPGSVTAANSRLPASAVTSAAVAKSAASLPSTLSALKPVATPVALVVSGAPVGGADLDAAAFLADGLNSKARPPLRLMARMQGSLPRLERQP